MEIERKHMENKDKYRILYKNGQSDVVTTRIAQEVIYAKVKHKNAGHHDPYLVLSSKEKQELIMVILDEVISVVPLFFESMNQYAFDYPVLH